MARAGVDRHHGVERRAGDQFVACQDRRHLECRAVQHVGGAALEIAGVVGPGRDQLVDVPRRDLVERREPATALIVAIVFGGAGWRGERIEREQQAGGQAQSANSHVQITISDVAAPGAAGRLTMRAIVVRDGRLDQVAALRTRTCEGPFRIGACQPVEADNISDENRRDFSSLGNWEQPCFAARPSESKNLGSLVAHRSDPDQTERRSRARISGSLRSDASAARFQHGRSRQILLVAPTPAFWCSLSLPGRLAKAAQGRIDPFMAPPGSVRSFSTADGCVRFPGPPPLLACS